MVQRLAVEDADLPALRRLGLTEYEARIYLTVVRLGPKTASEVSFFGYVPRTKVYAASKTLADKGLIKVIPGKPELYAPLSPSESLIPLAAKLENEAKDCKTLVHELGVLYESNRYVKRAVPRDAGGSWEMEDRRNIANKLNQTISGATKSVNYITTASGLIRAYKAHAEALEKVEDQGAVVRFVSPIPLRNRRVALEFSKIVKLRRVKQAFGLTLVSVDGRDLAVIECKPDDFRTDRGSDVAVWTTNQLILQLNEEFFKSIWNTSSRAWNAR